jgi:dTDP-4-amino-4,6-dideoxygalactose transaminase
MKVPFLDLGASYRELQVELESAVLQSLRSGWYIGGEDVAGFESDFAAYTHTSHCVGVANGLEALHLALLAMGVESGDEVIVPSNTFIATWLAVSECGAVPVPVEPDAQTCNIDVSKLVAAITPRTKVIIPVHLYGQPADLDSVLQIARHYGLLVLEDAAQAQGATYKGRLIGGHADAVAWSFYPGKNLGALGDAGAVTTQDAVLADKIRMLRNYGSLKRYVNEVQGYNSRLDPVQAAALRVKLRHLDAWNERRAGLAARYSASFVDSGLTLPFVPLWAKPSWHLYCVRHPMRDALRDKLTAAGVETLVHYPIPPHLQAAYDSLGYVKGAFPVAENMANTLLSLPIGPAMTEAQVSWVIESVQQACMDLAHA